MLRATGHARMVTGFVAAGRRETPIGGKCREGPRSPVNGSLCAARTLPQSRDFRFAPNAE